MKRTIILILILISTFSCKEVKSIALSLSLDGNTPNAYEDFILNVKLKNTGKDAIVIPQIGNSIKLELHNKDNDKVRYFVPHYLLKSNKKNTLKRNEVLLKKMNLSAIFPLTPNRYILKVIYNKNNRSSKNSLVKQIQFVVKRDPLCDRVDKNGNSKLILAVKSNNLMLVRKSLRGGCDPNVYNNDKKTAYDYAHSFYLTNKDDEKNYYIRKLLKFYNAKPACEFINIKCNKLSKDLISMRIVKAINNNNIHFIKDWISRNSEAISLIDIYSFHVSHVIELNRKNKKKTISKLNFLKLFPKNTPLNKRVFGKSILDYSIEDAKRTNSQEDKEVVNYLIKIGAKKSCEILKTKCD